MKPHLAACGETGAVRENGGDTPHGDSVVCDELYSEGWAIASILRPEKIMKTKQLTQTVLLISMAAFHSTTFAQAKPEVKAAVEEKAMIKAGSLTKVIADSATFSTLTAALKAAGLDGVLGGTDEFTIFAPTDEAFGKLPDGTLTKLLLPENKEKLRMLLLYHVVAGKTLAADLMKGEAKTVNGEKLKIDVSPGKVEVNGDKVFSADVSATNGVMHTIGKVLVPKSLDGFAGLKN